MSGARKKKATVATTRTATVTVTTAEMASQASLARRVVRSVDEDGDEGGRQHAADDDVGDDVGGGVGQVVAVGEPAAAQGGGQGDQLATPVSLDSVVPTAMPGGGAGQPAPAAARRRREPVDLDVGHRTSAGTAGSRPPPRPDAARRRLREVRTHHTASTATAPTDRMIPTTEVAVDRTTTCRSTAEAARR